MTNAINQTPGFGKSSRSQMTEKLLHLPRSSRTGSCACNASAGKIRGNPSRTTRPTQPGMSLRQVETLGFMHV